MRIPINRVVAFAGPYIAIVSAAIAAWLVGKVNVLGVPGLDKANTATWIGSGLTFALTAALTWLGHAKWLTGHHIQMEADAAITAAALAPVPTEQAINELDGTVVDPEVEDAPADVSDEEEFANPPDIAVEGEPESRVRPDEPDEG